MGRKVPEQKENAASNDFTVSVDLPTALQQKINQFIEEKKNGFQYFKKRVDTIKTLHSFLGGRGEGVDTRKMAAEICSEPSLNIENNKIKNLKRSFFKCRHSSFSLKEVDSVSAKFVFRRNKALPTL